MPVPNSSSVSGSGDAPAIPNETLNFSPSDLQEIASAGKPTIPDNRADDLVEIPQNLDDLNLPEDGKPEPAAVDDFMSEAELLQEEGLEYPDVRAALRAFKETQANFTRDHQIVQRLQQAAQALGGTPEDLIRSLSSIDPRQHAGNLGAQWGNLEAALEKNISAEYHPTYKNLMSAAMADMVPAIEGRFARILNSMEARMGELVFDMHLDKFARLPKNAEWIGREQEIKEAYLINPTYHNKPNAIDLAVRFVKAGVEPKSVQRQVSEETKKKLQAIRAKGRAGFVEGPGRTVPGPVPTSDVDKMKPDQLGQLIDRAERAGKHMF